MADIQLTINGREVKAEEGMTIFQAAERAGVRIPHLCYRDDLTPTTGCRMCVVEVEGARTLVASCAYPVANKMVVRTETPRVRDARKLVLEFLLSDHPYDCMTCEKSGSCKLEKYAYEYGIRKSRFEGEAHGYPIRAANPFFERDYNKCILCGRCVTVCYEIQYCEAVDSFQTGVCHQDCRLLRPPHAGDPLRLLWQLCKRLSRRSAQRKSGTFPGTGVGAEEDPDHLLLLRRGMYADPQCEGQQDPQGHL